MYLIHCNIVLVINVCITYLVKCTLIDNTCHGISNVCVNTQYLQYRQYRQVGNIGSINSIDSKYHLLCMSVS